MKPKIVLLGASTGGPSIIKELLHEVKDLSSIIIINQHMKQEVLPFFIKDVQNSYNFRVETTPVTFSLNSPCVIVCSHSSIIQKVGDNFQIRTDTSSQQYTPDINQFFNSFAEYVDIFDTDVIIMTGIGSDGATGARTLKKYGAKVYAQDEGSSPVYGMPKSVFELGIVDKVLSLNSLKAYFRNL